MTDAPELLQRWLERVQRLDLVSLAEMYAHQATVRSPSEVWMGREEIEDGLIAARRLFKGMQVEDVTPLEHADGSLRFETQVRGRLGRARIRHHWTLHDDQIQGHVLEILRHDKVAA